MISMTEGCNVSPLNSRSKSGCASSSVTSTPALASNSDITAPPGPPPTTQQVVRLTSRTSDAGSTRSSRGLSVCMRPPSVRVEGLSRKSQPPSVYVARTFWTNPAQYGHLSPRSGVWEREELSQSGHGTATHPLHRLKKVSVSYAYPKPCSSRAPQSCCK